MARNLSFFDDQRTTLEDSIEMTRSSLLAYAASYRHWAIAYSGGKDSTELVRRVVTQIERGEVPAPASLTVLYADTRQELPPLYYSAMHNLSSSCVWKRPPMPGGYHFDAPRPISRH